MRNRIDMLNKSILFFYFFLKTSAKTKANVAESKPPTCKKLKIFEVRPGERFDEGVNSKKFGTYVGKCNNLNRLLIF